MEMNYNPSMLQGTQDLEDHYIRDFTVDFLVYGGELRQLVKEFWGRVAKPAKWVERRATPERRVTRRARRRTDR